LADQPRCRAGVESSHRWHPCSCIHQAEEANAPVNIDQQQHRAILRAIARQAMLERGLLPDFSAEVQAEIGQFRAQVADDPSARDLTGLLWASIDNDDSRDLDQVTVAEALPDGRVRLLVAIADVDSLVSKGSATDEHAQHNTTSVYTAAQVFPMLPEELSTGLTSLNPGEKRSSIIIEMVVDAGGSVAGSDVYRARVHNKAKLAYNSVAAWLDGIGPEPEPIGAVEGLAENLRLQDKTAQAMKGLRHARGALSLETIEARPTFDGDAVHDLVPEERNRAKELIEDFMIAANGVSARYLSAKGSPSIRRVVREPRRWDRIVQLAAERGSTLPSAPDAKALETFLLEQKAADPLRFPDLSLSVIKLLGPGEYVAEMPGEDAPGHFGLAVRDYGHSTAPNRRYTDLVTQRLLKAALAGATAPYTKEVLDSLATHCTEEEDAANKVERQVAKSAAALLFGDRIGEEFDGIVTGASYKGTWVRLLAKPVEGKVVQRASGLDVGDRVRVRLLSVDVERGFIDFARVG
jgi:VacB/RNase II family 3'-5' exoribonuclease